MNTVFQLMLQSRKNLQGYLDKLTIDQLNTVPIGFNNNIIWNIAHIVATSDLLCYKLNNIPMRLPQNFIDEFRKGTVPQRMIDELFVDELKKNIIAQVQWIESDYKAHLFPEQIPLPYMTSYHFELTSIENILQFNLIHEGLHLGMIMSLKKFI